MVKPVRSKQTTQEVLANWLRGHWFKILSISIPLLISVSITSFYLGQFYANLNFEYEKIKLARECSDRLNQEIDKNRQLHDEQAKKSIDDLKELTKEFKQAKK